MNKLTEAFNSLASKLGVGLSGTGLAGVGMSSPLIKLLLLLLAVPIAPIMLGLLFVERRVMSFGRNVRKWVVTKTATTLLVLATATWIGFAGWTAYEHFREHHLFIAAGSRTAESYPLAQAVKTITLRHASRISMTILEIEGAPGDTGVLEQGIVQMVIAPSDLPVGSSGRSVAPLAKSSQVLLVRSDVDERVVYALTQALTQFSEEFAAALPVGKAAPKTPAAKTQKPEPQAQSKVPLHAGAAAFYDRDKTRFVFRYPRLCAFVLAGLTLLGLWIWHWRRRTRPKPIIQPIRFSPPPEREPWTFAKILLESVGEISAPLPVEAAAATNNAKINLPQKFLFRPQRRKPA